MLSTFQTNLLAQSRLASDEGIGKRQTEFSTFIFIFLVRNLQRHEKSSEIIYTTHRSGCAHFCPNKAYFYCAMAISTRLSDYKINYSSCKLIRIYIW
jgi:hypothetical protein